VTATDAVGNVATLGIDGINLDATAPTVAFVGVQPSYQQNEQVTIRCVASDGLSGIDSAICPDLEVLAADLPVGANSLTATVTDLAGNTTAVTVAFEVMATSTGP
jgi:hypothetical protein